MRGLEATSISSAPVVTTTLVRYVTPVVPQYVLVISTFPVASIGHEVTGVQLLPLASSRYSVPVVVVAELMEEMYTDTDICLPETVIDGTTIFVLSHRGRWSVLMLLAMHLLRFLLPIQGLHERSLRERLSMSTLRFLSFS